MEFTQKMKDFYGKSASGNPYIRQAEQALFHTDVMIANGSPSRAKQRLQEATVFQFKADGVVPPMRLTHDTDDWSQLSKPLPAQTGKKK